jgi:hypothetical protein
MLNGGATGLHRPCRRFIDLKLADEARFSPAVFAKG